MEENIKIQLLGFESQHQYEDVLNKLINDNEIKCHMTIGDDTILLDNPTKEDLYAIRSFIYDTQCEDYYKILGDDADEYYIDIDDLLDDDACIETVYFDF